ncbi:MAG TPA: RNA-binding protein [Lachnospiraceae bacterium]|nr:RNA-binding protein [Lachnospiraceae bacterium]
MITKNNLLSFASDDDEKLIFAKLFDKVGAAERTFSPTFSVFINPFVAHKAADLLKSTNTQIMLYGGYKEAERVMMGFFPEFTEANETDFPIKILEIAYSTKFSSTLTHREILGSVLGLGITREKIGDIIIQEGRAVIYCTDDVSDYILTSLTRASRTSVKVKLLEGFIPDKLNEKVKKITVASLRLDLFLSKAFGISRGKAAELIHAQKAFVNWGIPKNNSVTLSPGDIITLRGYGRVKINALEGKTKKDNTVIAITVY